MKLNVDQVMRKAATAARAGDLDQAEAHYREILAVFPTNKRALTGLAELRAPAAPRSYDEGVQAVLGFYDKGRLQDAVDLIGVLLGKYPKKSDLHTLAGACLAGLGRWDEAVQSYEQAIRLNPGDVDAQVNRSVALIRLQRFEEALDACDRALKLQPNSANGHSNRGMVLRQLGRLDAALAAYDMAMRFQPDSPEIQYNRANLMLDREQYLDAVTAYDGAIALRPGYAAAHSNRGNALKALERHFDALASYDAAIAAEPGFAEAHSNRGLVLLGLKRVDEALEACTQAAILQPGVAEVHYNLGTILQDQNRLDDAVACYDRAVAIDPTHVRGHGNRGTALQSLLRLDEALASYDRVVALKPDDAAGHVDRGNVLQQQLRLEEAVDAYGRAIALNPGHAEAQAQLIFQRARMCDWSDVAELADLAALGITTGAVAPFALLAIEDHAEHHFQRARKWVSEKVKGSGIAFPTMRAPSPRIRIGYFSADFHNHATMHLLAKLLERHDRSRFEIHAFSYGARRDAMTERAIAAVDAFHDISAMSDKAAADFAKKQAIDIAVDLKGHTQEARLGIFSHRPAPVQIAWLGYPGTTGASFIDYMIADPVVLPEAHRPYYAEKIITLPDSYQANDDGRAIADRVYARAELGLPEDGVVFASFNSNYKIRPAELDAWARILEAVEGSSLWLLRDNIWAEANLKREAEARGIDPARLVFADRAALPEHLARHAVADLFLDSFNCNAHTTASDALWAGLPLLTRLGDSFASRVAASLLQAVGLPELAVETVEDYVETAIAIAQDPVRIAALKAKLAANRATAPLFDTDRLTRQIETAFDMAHERRMANQRPDHFDVPALAENRKAA